MRGRKTLAIVLFAYSDRIGQTLQVELTKSSPKHLAAEIKYS